MEFKRLCDVEVVVEPTESANVLIEENGVIKKAPKTAVGGAGEETDMVIALTHLGYRDEVANIGDSTLAVNSKNIDIYLFVYRTDLGLCLQDYFNLTGYPPMIPRYSLGCWWYKNDRYNYTRRTSDRSYSERF